MLWHKLWFAVECRNDVHALLTPGQWEVYTNFLSKNSKGFLGELSLGEKIEICSCACHEGVLLELWVHWFLKALDGWRWALGFTLRTLYFGRMPSVSIVLEDGRFSEQVWMLWRRGNLLSLPRRWYIEIDINEIRYVAVNWTQLAQDQRTGCHEHRQHNWCIILLSTWQKGNLLLSWAHSINLIFIRGPIV